MAAAGPRALARLGALRGAPHPAAPLRSPSRLFTALPEPKRASYQTVFTVGVPGSGKTCVLRRAFAWWSDRLVIDLDDEMRQHPAYDPAAPHRAYDSPEAYAWADARVEARFAAAVAARVPNRLIVMDGTGTRVASRVGRMALAREHGYRVGLLYVRVTLETALRRNARRRRQVPEATLREYFARVAAAAALERAHVDDTWVVDNDAESSECEGIDDGEDEDGGLVCIPRAVLDEDLGNASNQGGLFGPHRTRDALGNVVVPESLRGEHGAGEGGHGA